MVVGCLDVMSKGLSFAWVGFESTYDAIKMNNKISFGYILAVVAVLAFFSGYYTYNIDNLWTGLSQMGDVNVQAN